MPSLLVACEFSGTVRDAFIRKGWDAVSCDLLPTEAPGPHHQGDVLAVLGDGWDMMIAHPPCTYLTVSGARWMYDDRFPDRARQQAEALEFFRALLNAPIPRIAVENPVGVASTLVGPPSQVVQPFHYGHPETKATCLWLRGLPKLVPTNIVPLPADPRLRQRIHWIPPGPRRWMERSKTFQGIAAAMAEQWSGWPEVLPLFRELNTPTEKETA